MSDSEYPVTQMELEQSRQLAHNRALRGNIDAIARLTPENAREVMRRVAAEYLGAVVNPDTSWRRKSNSGLSAELKKYDVRIYVQGQPWGYLEVFVGREPVGPGGALRWHLSIASKNRFTHEPGEQLPTWEHIHDARYRFCPDEITMAMMLPPKDAYVNIHPSTMHLFEVEADQFGEAPG